MPNLDSLIFTRLSYEGLSYESAITKIDECIANVMFFGKNEYCIVVRDTDHSMIPQVRTLKMLSAIEVNEILQHDSMDYFIALTKNQNT